MRSVAGTWADTALSSVVFPVPVPPEMRMLSFPRTQCARKSAVCSLRLPSPMRSSSVSASLRELPDRQRRAAERERRDDRVDPAAVGQSGIDHRRRLVDAAADLRHDAVDDAQQMRVVEEGGVGLLDPAGALDVELVRPVHHHLGDGRILEERLEWAVPEDVVGNLPLELGALAWAERGFLRVELLGDDLPDAAARARRCPPGSGTRCRGERCRSCGSSSSARHADRGPGAAWSRVDLETLGENRGVAGAARVRFD